MVNATKIAAIERVGLCPIIPSAIVATHATTVKPTTHHLRRRLASATATRSGIETRMTALATALTTAYSVLLRPSSSTSQTTKYSDNTFIEKIVLAKS